MVFSSSLFAIMNGHQGQARAHRLAGGQACLTRPSAETAESTAAVDDRERSESYGVRRRSLVTRPGRCR